MESDFLNWLYQNPTYVEMEAAELTHDENEIEIYIKGIDLTKVKSLYLETEYQLQYGLFSEKDDKKTVASGHRVRKSTVFKRGEEPETFFTKTFKLFMPDGTKPESTEDTSEEAFNLFKLGCDSGMEKIRYKIPVDTGGDQRLFEVDVFEDTTWVKIDLELPPGLKLAREVVVSYVESTFGTFEEAIYVYPHDKVEKSEGALRAQKIMRDMGTLKGPFTTEVG